MSRRAGLFWNYCLEMGWQYLGNAELLFRFRFTMWAYPEAENVPDIYNFELFADNNLQKMEEVY